MEASLPDSIDRRRGHGPFVGAAVRRREDLSLITGAGRFLDDIMPPDTVYLRIVRSPHAHARIRAVRTTDAASSPGVVTIVTAADLPSPVPVVPAGGMFPGVEIARHPLLADGVVRYVGQPVAAVVARAPYAARDAAERVVVEYEPLVPVVDVDAALAPGAPVLHGALGSNLVFALDVESGDPDRAFADADIVVEADLRQPRLAPVTMECRGVVAAYDGARDRLEVWLSTQGPHGARDEIAEALGMPPERIRVIAPDVGGGFGAKGGVYPDEVLAVYLADRLRRPVKWIEDRSENLRAMTHGRGQRARLRAAATREGVVRAVTGEITADLGAYCLSSTAVIPFLTTRVALGAYRIPNVRLQVRGAATTLTPTGAYRGAGRPEGAYYIERLIDLVAARTGIDPAEVRRRNFIERFPYQGATHLAYDSGNYHAALDAALERVGYEDWRREQARRRRDGGTPLGIGIATWIEIAGGGDSWEHGTVRVERSGAVTVLTGSSAHGQGHETVFSQIVADRLGVSLDQIAVRHGDTDVVPEGVGTFGSRSLAIGGSAVAKAADAVRERVIAQAARLLEASPDDLVLADGRVAVRGAPERAVTFARLAEAAEADPSAELAASLRYEASGGMVPSGAHVAVVELDPDTGAVRILRYVAVDDCGVVVNPLLVDGQVHGGLAQGIAQALQEEVVYDDDGQLLTGSLSDYAVPAAAQLPRFETDRTETRTPTNLLGAKGVGEAGTTGAPPAVVNAVLDAVRPFGIEALDMPLTAERVWRALRGTAKP